MAISTWQIWLLIGLLLAAAELMGASFILVALGVTAFVVALATALYPGMSVPAQLLLFAATGLALVPGFVYQFRRWHRSRASTMAGEAGGDASPTLAVETDGRRPGVRLHGDFFPAEARDGGELVVGEHVRIHHFEGITARVTRVDTTAGDDPPP